MPLEVLLYWTNCERNNLFNLIKKCSGGFGPKSLRSSDCEVNEREFNIPSICTRHVWHSLAVSVCRFTIGLFSHETWHSFWWTRNFASKFCTRGGIWNENSYQALHKIGRVSLSGCLPLNILYKALIMRFSHRQNWCRYKTNVVTSTDECLNRRTLASFLS